MITFLTIISTIGGFFIKNWDTVATLLTTLGTLFGISWLQVFNRTKKIAQETREEELIATASAERVETIKKVKEKRAKQGKFEFSINNIMLIIGCGFLNWFVYSVAYPPLSYSDPDFAKSILSGLIFIDFFILLIIAARIISSVNTFDKVMQSLPLIKNFFKK